MKIKLQPGDALYEPISNNTGEILKIIPHPNGKIVLIRWRMEGQLHHDTEHFYAKVAKSIKHGEMEYTPKLDKN